MWNFFPRGRTPPVWEFSPDLPSFLVFWSPASLPVRSPFPDQQRRRSQSCSSNTGVLTLFQHWCASVLLPTAGAAVLFQYRIHNTTQHFNSSAQHEGMDSNHLFHFIKSLHNMQYFKLILTLHTKCVAVPILLMELYILHFNIRTMHFELN